MSFVSEKKSWLPALACALAGATLFQFFGNATRGYIDTTSLYYWWGYQWFDPASETEHGVLILAVSLWLFWRNVRATGPARPPAEGWGPAVAALVGGLGLHAAGFAMQQTRLSIVALLVFLWGTLRLAGGRRWGGAAAFPLGFMTLAIPLNALDSLGFWLRMWVIDASAALAHAAGIGVLQNGTLLVAPDGRYNYDVAAACSGVRSLTALAALSLLAGYLNFHSWWRRGVALLLCFPLVYLGNVARISSIVFAARWGGQAWGEHAHDFMGYGVFAIVLGGVLGAIRALRRRWPEVAPPAAAVGPRRGERVSSSLDGNLLWPAAAAVVALAFGEMVLLHHLATLPARGAAGVLLTADGKNPADLPAFLGRDWLGRAEPVSPAERQILPPDTGFSRRNYFNERDPAQRVFLSIVLSGRDRTSIHRPELCLVGQGWTITGRGEHSFEFPGQSGANFSATLLRVQHAEPISAAAIRAGTARVVPELTAYWFVSSDTVVASHWRRLAHDAWNRLVHARADRWAYVLMQTDATDGEAAALARMQAVLREALPSFQRPIVAH